MSVENECTEFGCRLHEAKSRLHEWVKRHDAAQKRIAELERERDEARREAEWWRTGIHGESTPEFAFFPWETEAQPGD